MPTIIEFIFNFDVNVSGVLDFRSTVIVAISLGSGSIFYIALCV